MGSVRSTLVDIGNRSTVCVSVCLSVLFYPNGEYSRIGYKVAVTDGLDEQLGQFDDFLATALLLILQRGARVGRLLHLRTFALLRNHRLACKSASGGQSGLANERY